MNGEDDMGRKLFFNTIALLLLISGVGTVYASETAVLAGGCFWGVEGVYEHVTGVLEVESGYAGGKAGTANYNAVSKGVFPPCRVGADNL